MRVGRARRRDADVRRRRQQPRARHGGVRPRARAAPDIAAGRAAERGVRAAQPARAARARRGAAPVRRRRRTRARGRAPAAGARARDGAAAVRRADGRHVAARHARLRQRRARARARRSRRASCPRRTGSTSPLGSMGTAAGLILGLRARRSADARRRGARHAVASGRTRSKLAALLADTVALLREAGAPTSPTCPADAYEVRHDAFGEEYARFTAEGMAAVRAAGEAGLRLEGTYTGKTMAALLADARGGHARRRRRRCSGTPTTPGRSSAWQRRTRSRRCRRSCHRFFTEPLPAARRLTSGASGPGAGPRAVERRAEGWARLAPGRSRRARSSDLGHADEDAQHRDRLEDREDRAGRGAARRRRATRPVREPIEDEPAEEHRAARSWRPPPRSRRARAARARSTSRRRAAREERDRHGDDGVRNSTANPTPRLGSGASAILPVARRVNSGKSSTTISSRTARAR